MWKSGLDSCYLPEGFIATGEALMDGSYLKVHNWRRNLAVRYLSSNESSYNGQPPFMLYVASDGLS